MSRILGIDVPTSTINIQGRSFRYLAQPPGMDSYGATSGPEWPSPTSLEFQSERMDAEKLGVVAEIGDMPMPPEEFLGRTTNAIRSSVARVARMLQPADGPGRVVERSGMLMEFKVGPFHGTAVRTTAITWPDVPGVTSRYEDNTR